MLAQMILIILEVQLGAGQHTDAVSHENNIKGLRLNFVTQPLCLTGLVLVKISIGLLLVRFTTSRKFKNFIWGVIVFTSAAFIGNLRQSTRGFQVLIFTDPLSSDGDAPMSPASANLGLLCQG